jgi:hypothetical protein
VARARWRPLRSQLKSLLEELICCGEGRWFPIEVRLYDELIAALRCRKHVLDVSFLTLDETSVLHSS